MSNAHAKTTKAMSGQYDMYKAGALASIKTVEEYRQDWAGKSTKKLIAYEHELRIEKVNTQLAYDKAVAESDTVQARISKNRIAQINAEKRALAEVSLERESVQKGGVGALIGQLGIGRSLSGFSAGGLVGGLGAIGGVAGGAILLKDFYSAGEKAIDIQDRLRIAYTAAGVPLSGLGDEMARTNKLATTLSAEWNIESDRVRQVSLDVASLGRVHGQANSDIVKASLAIEEMTKSLGEGAITAEQFAKTFNVQDPEREVYLGRLKMKYRDLAEALGQAKNTGDALRITTEYLGEDFKGLDERAGSNAQAMTRASVAWAEVKRQIGVDFVTGAGLALGAISDLSGGVLSNTELLAGLTIAIGGAAAALTAYVVVQKIAHSETGLEIASKLAEIPLRIQHAVAIHEETAAMLEERIASGSMASGTSALGATLRSVMPAVGLFAVPVAALGVAYEVVKDKQQKVIDGNKEFLDSVEKLPPPVRQAMYDQMAWGGSLGTARAKALLASEGTQVYLETLKTVPQKTKEATDATLKFAGALVSADQANLTSAKDFSDKAGALIEYYDKRLADPSVTGAKRTAFEEGKKEYQDYLTSIGHYVKSAQDLHEKIFAPYNAIVNPDKTAKTPKERPNIADPAKAQFEDYKQMLADLAKAQKETYDQMTIEQEITSQRNVNALEEQGSSEKDLAEKTYEEKKNLLTLELEHAEQVYTQQSKEYVTIQLKMEELQHQHNLRIIADDKKTAAEQLKLQDELRKAVGKYNEEQNKIADKAAEDSLKEQKKLVMDLVDSGLKPLNTELDKVPQAWRAIGGVAGQILGDIYAKLLKIVEQKGLDKLAELLFPEKKSVSPLPLSMMPGSSGMPSITGEPLKVSSDNIGAFLSHLADSGVIKSFNDSGMSIGESGTLMIGGKAVVMGDPGDWLVNPNNLSDNSGTPNFAKIATEGLKKPSTPGLDTSETTKVTQIITLPKVPVGPDTNYLPGYDPSINYAEAEKKRQYKEYRKLNRSDAIATPEIDPISVAATGTPALIQHGVAAAASHLIQHAAAEKALGPLMDMAGEAISGGKGDEESKKNTKETKDNTTELAALNAAIKIGAGAGKGKDTKSTLIGVAAGASSLLNLIMPGLGTSVGALISQFAEGTDYAPGGLSLVGERGPELRYIPRGNQIIPTNKIRAGGSDMSETNRLLNALVRKNTSVNFTTADVYYGATVGAQRAENITL